MGLFAECSACVIGTATEIVNIPDRRETIIVVAVAALCLLMMRLLRGRGRGRSN
ncbi:MAG TPA: hypothetical protein VG733_08640 [Chthoniobacteraceae bacterium]|nr:hypothetical protein [Chthoniobacteraceae bacterium]